MASTEEVVEVGYRSGEEAAGHHLEAVEEEQNQKAVVVAGEGCQQIRSSGRAVPDLGVGP